MTIKCELCTHDDGPTLNLMDGDELREHLIVDHCKQVARAFLKPRLHQKDQWLWSNITFDEAMLDLPQCSDAEVQNASFNLLQPIGQVIRTFFHMIFEKFEGSEDQKRAFFDLVEQYFPMDDPTKTEVESDDVISQRFEEDERNPILDIISASIQMSLLQNDLPFVAPKSEPVEIFEPEAESESREMSPTEFRQTVAQLFDKDNSSAPQNSEENVLRAPLSKRIIADSKAIRTATCQSCHKKVCMTARQRHVYMAHVNKKDMFICPQCDYTNSNSIWEARKHCESHDPPCKPESNEKKYVKIIRACNAMCFPNWREKKFAVMEEMLTYAELQEAEAEISQCTFDAQNNRIAYDDDTADDALNALLTKVEKEMYEEAEETDEIPDKQRQQTSSSQSHLSHATTSSSTSEEDEKEPPEDTKPTTRARKDPKPEEPPVDRHVCRKCNLECRYPGRHIVQKHLGKPLYVCPVCETFGTYEACAVGKHIESVHKRRDLKPISKMEEYVNELRQLQTECFPDRQMKLVPSSLGSKPRERHVCKICNADVAQSDRQRHVYHRHLRQPKLFECPLCDFHSDYDIHRVSWHIKWTHKNNQKQPITHEAEFRESIDRLNEECFPGWKHRKSLAAQEEKMANQGRRRTGTPRSRRALSQASSTTSDRSRMVEDNFLEEEPASLAPVANKRPIRNTRSNTDAKKIKLEAVPEIFCENCQFSVPESEELTHILSDHLALEVYKCPVCKTYNSDEQEQVAQHMKDAHKNTIGVPLLNIENVDEILAEHKNAFPERTLVLDKWQAGNGVQCRECGMLMKTEDRQIHVYRHHLRKQDLYECLYCEFSHHACSSDVKSHMRHVHNQHDACPKANIEKYAQEIDEWNSRCFNGWINRRLPSAASKDFEKCRLCLTEIQQTSRHIAEVHMNIHLHQCPLCDYGASEARLVRRHIRNFHDGAAEELEPIANVVQRRAEFAAFHEKCFPGRPKRLSNIVISEEGRRTKCKECGKTISRKRRLDHLLEYHLKKKVFKCSSCSFGSNFDKLLVEQHVEKHKGARLVNDVPKHAAKLEDLSKKCFKDQQINLDM
ncbi:unnamed protein product [Bursaphelenchus xylophilus]|uniref:(pine wood nematode) hypothetical protein n=1 Tax=Bursaphelenchus xylophilus TaxID=6326 RepID=A0A1I7SE56_BURXY|nr:unnamed protein product [Bursaphelenchus xylophilus]CAG9104162.1 unnamed protein product [Bursaphelenchus xylophilus]